MAMEVEIFQGARDEVNKAALIRRVQTMMGRKIIVICRVLGISRATAHRPDTARRRRFVEADDRIVTAPVREVIATRAT
jgi:hypothetical protein